MLRNLLVLTAAMLAAAACGPLSARPLVDLAVIDRDSGQWLPEYPHHGQHWIPGTPGHRYAVRLTNTSSERVLVVLSVDGVNAVSGQTADPAQAGYVLAPWQSTEINGWRKSLDDVAQFVFTDLPDSYAARTGRPDNVGVIGVAVFRKKAEPAVSINRYHERRRAAPAADAPSAEAQDAGKNEVAQSGRSEASAPVASAIAPPPESKKLGTGHGQTETSVVRHANFERATSSPDEVITIFYDSYRNLVAQGVIRDRTRLAQPQPFPGQFVPDPR